jgi:hypothetical protein
LYPQVMANVSAGDGQSDLTANICGFIGRPSEQTAWEEMDAESLETVAGVAYFDAQLSWHGRKPTLTVPGHRDSDSCCSQVRPRRDAGL